MSSRPIRATRSREAKSSEAKLFAYDASLNTKWTTQEKQLLLEALKRYPTESLNLIQKNFLPERKLQEIDEFIKKMKIRAKSYKDATQAPSVQKAPIELWLEKAEDLTYYDFDYSYVLPQVMSVAGNLEKHDPKQTDDDPDWSKLYGFVVALLRGERPPGLNPVESAVLLDVLEGLADQMKTMDTSQQRELMRRKYALLNTAIDVNNKEACYAFARKALEEDLLESDMCPKTILASIPKVIRKPGRRPRGQEAQPEQRPKKTSLYSINPYCIPVKYLKPASKARPPTTAGSSGTPTPVSGGSRAKTGTATPVAGGSRAKTGTATPVAGGSRAKTGTATPVAGGSRAKTSTSTPVPGYIRTEANSPIPVSGFNRAETGIPIPVPGGNMSQTAQSTPMSGGSRVNTVTPTLMFGGNSAHSGTPEPPVPRNKVVQTSKSKPKTRTNRGKIPAKRRRTVSPDPPLPDFSPRVDTPYATDVNTEASHTAISSFPSNATHPADIDMTSQAGSSSLSSGAHPNVRHPHTTLPSGSFHAYQMGEPGPGRVTHRYDIPMSYPHHPHSGHPRMVPPPRPTGMHSAVGARSLGPRVRGGKFGVRQPCPSRQLLQETPKQKKISIKETEGGSTTICITDLL